MKRVSPKWRLAQMSTCWFLKQWYHIDGMGPEVPFKTLFWLLVLVQSWDSHFHIRVGEGRWGEWCPTCFISSTQLFPCPLHQLIPPLFPLMGFHATTHFIWIYRVCTLKHNGVAGKQLSLDAHLSWLTAWMNAAGQFGDVFSDEKMKQNRQWIGMLIQITCTRFLQQ